MPCHAHARARPTDRPTDHTQFSDVLPHLAVPKSQSFVDSDFPRGRHCHRPAPLSSHDIPRSLVDIRPWVTPRVIRSMLPRNSPARPDRPCQLGVASSSLHPPLKRVQRQYSTHTPPLGPGSPHFKTCPVRRSPHGSRRPSTSPAVRPDSRCPLSPSVSSSAPPRTVIVSAPAFSLFRRQSDSQTDRQTGPSPSSAQPAQSGTHTCSSPFRHAYLSGLVPHAHSPCVRQRPERPDWYQRQNSRQSLWCGVPNGPPLLHPQPRLLRSHKAWQANDTRRRRHSFSLQGSRGDPVQVPHRQWLPPVSR